MSISSINTAAFAVSYTKVKRDTSDVSSGNLLTKATQPEKSKEVFLTATSADKVTASVNKDGNIAPPLYGPSSPPPTTAIFGDFDGDGSVGATDLGMLLSAYGKKGGMEDINRDGKVNDQDLNILLANWGDVSGRVKKEYTTHDFGDVNGDGNVDISDLSQVLSDWGQKTGDIAKSTTNSDLNGDGIVNEQDLKLVLGYWGQDVKTMVAIYNKENGLSTAGPDPKPSITTASDDAVVAGDPTKIKRRHHHYGIRDDLKELRHDRRELHHDKVEKKKDRHQVLEDHKELKQDRKEGNWEEFRADLEKLHYDVKELRADRREIRNDHREIREDRHELKHDLRQWHRDRKDA